MNRFLDPSGFTYETYTIFLLLFVVLVVLYLYYKTRLENEKIHRLNTDWQEWYNSELTQQS